MKELTQDNCYCSKASLQHLTTITSIPVRHFAPATARNGADRHSVIVTCRHNSENITSKSNTDSNSLSLIREALASPENHKRPAKESTAVDSKDKTKKILCRLTDDLKDRKRSSEFIVFSRISIPFEDKNFQGCHLLTRSRDTTAASSDILLSPIVCFAQHCLPT